MSTIIDDGIELGAARLAELIRTGEASSHDVVEALIARIEDVDSLLNAVPIRLFEQAMAAADAADDLRSRGADLGPLHGVPITIKEQFRVRSTPTTGGYTGAKGNIYQSEGPMVTALRDAGAIILGKTNVMQALGGWECDNPVYGRANNPWDLSRTPGGSSGGEAAIIAAGGSPLGLASDLGGSIRFPAFFCGVHGFKPTSGRLTNEDTPLDIFRIGQETIRPQPGPIARRVEDLALAISVLSSATPQKNQPPPLAPMKLDPVDISSLRIGYYTDSGYFPAAPSIRRAVQEAAAWLQNAGAKIVEVASPDTEEGMHIFVGVFSADGSSHVTKLLGKDRALPGLRGSIQGSKIPAPLRGVAASIMHRRGNAYMADLIAHAGPRSAASYWDLVQARSVYRANFHQMMDEANLDAILSPPFAVPAPLHESTDDLIPAGSYGLIYSVLGSPVGVVTTSSVQPGEESDRAVSKDQAVRTARRVELHSTGLPVGVQVAARHWRDDIVLSVMQAIELQARRTDSYPNHPSALAK